jgi:hypothetical protein
MHAFIQATVLHTQPWRCKPLARITDLLVLALVTASNTATRLELSLLRSSVTLSVDIVAFRLMTVAFNVELTYCFHCGKSNNGAVNVASVVRLALAASEFPSSKPTPSKSRVAVWFRSPMRASRPAVRLVVLFSSYSQPFRDTLRQQAARING